MFDMRVINNIQYYYVKESLLHYVALLKTTNASFSFVIVHVGAYYMPARLHSPERMSSLVISLFAMTGIDTGRDNGFTVTPIRANGTSLSMGMGLSRSIGKKRQIFIVGSSPICRRRPSPLRNTIFNCIRPSRRPFTHIILTGHMHELARESAGRTLLIIGTSNRCRGEACARGRNTDIPACFLAGMHYNASTMHRRGIHQSYDYVSDYERRSDTAVRFMPASLSIRRIDHQITHCSTLERYSLFHIRLPWT